MVAKRFVVLRFLFKFYKKLLFPLSAIGLHEIYSSKRRFNWHSGFLLYL